MRRVDRPHEGRAASACDAGPHALCASAGCASSANLMHPRLGNSVPAQLRASSTTLVEKAGLFHGVAQASSHSMSRHCAGLVRASVLNNAVFTLLRVALLACSVCLTSANVNPPTPYNDVCQAEEYMNYIQELCPPVFRVSTIAFDPLYPKESSQMTIILQPSESFYSQNAQKVYIDINLPGYEPIGTISASNALIRNMKLEGNNPVQIGQDPTIGYNTKENPIFMDPAKYDTSTGILRLQVKNGVTLLTNVDTEVTICCLLLPASSAMDSTALRISAPTSLDDIVRVRDEPILKSPYIDPGVQFNFLQVLFDPPLSHHLAVISLTMRTAVALDNQCLIRLHLPSITREPEVSGLSVIEFNTAGSGDGTDWMLFNHEALWNNETRTITFYLREGATLPAGREVTLKTNPGEFRLPIEIESNWPDLKVEARSNDDIDMIIRPTSVLQASRVPHVRFFSHAELKYVKNEPYAMSNVQLIFSTNRPMFAGTTIYLRLAGFQSEVVDVPLLGPTAGNFNNERAVFDLPGNTITLKVNRTLYSDEVPVSVLMANLLLPPSAYENDPSLLIWNSDSTAVQESIDKSPAIFNGHKEFIRSQLLFSPMEPRMPANITFIIQPSIVFYEGDSIILHLYGFLYSEGRRVPLTGPQAHFIKDSAAVWNAEEHTLEMIVAQNEIITNTDALTVNIDQSSNFRLPDKLSKNDGICRIEGRGALILKEPMKKTPKIGDEKFVIDSRIEFEPIPNGVLSSSIARISFFMILNTDVLPNSTIYIKLGGLRRQVPMQANLQSGPITLSGANAPLFVGGIGQWDATTNYLTVKIVPNVQIYSGEKIRFFLERDQYFKLPYAMYPNDPSFRIMIPEAGISERKFNFSTRVSQDTKRFIRSILFYGTYGDVAYPNTVVDVTLEFQPNVDIPQGSVFRVHLPGYSSPVTRVPMRAPDTQVVGKAYLATTIPFGNWDQLNYNLDLEVPVGTYISRGALNVIRILKADGGFRLPTSALAPNDMRLTIAVIKNQIIYAEPIKESPRVVDRSFAISEFEYRPAMQQSIFMLVMRLQPTVNITDSTDIIISLPGFVNSLNKVNIHLIGESRGLIRESMAQWNATDNELTMKVPENTEIPAFQILSLRITESQGFILPSDLNANDTRIRIRAVNNIQSEPVKKSPMVGNGPYFNHLYCMKQFERGVRTGTPRCQVSEACLPPNEPLRDPCSAIELDRCDCPPLTDDPVNITVEGFQLQETDTISFIPMTQQCGVGNVAGMLSPFSPPQRIYLSPTNHRIEYENISSVDSGYYKVCINHVGTYFDIGMIVVRPTCPIPLVLVDGVCVENCPRTKIPIAGSCKRDSVSMEPEERQALLVSLKVDDPQQKADIANLPPDDADRKYFKYRFVYDLAKLLDCDPSRIKIASLSNGSVIVNTVFEPVVMEDDPVTVTTERTPMGLVELLKALHNDTSSAMHLGNTLFKHVDRAPLPAPVRVRMCTEDGTYRVFCPFVDGTIESQVIGTLTFFIISDSLVLVLILLCAGCWRVDKERGSNIDEDLILKLQKDPTSQKPETQKMWASSWLDGRFMGEDWQKARNGPFPALKG